MSEINNFNKNNIKPGTTSDKILKIINKCSYYYQYI